MNKSIAYAAAGAVVGGAIAWSMSRSTECPYMARSKGPLAEYSVIYTDRAVNLMASPFQATMRNISKVLKETYNASASVIIPGSGTYAMEAVAFAFAKKKKALVIRNGYFSYRWSDIFHVGKIPLGEEVVLKARPAAGQEGEAQPQLAPMPLADVVARIRAERPAVVFAPHVETSTGMILPDEYIKAVAAAAHEVGGIFVLDAIAAGTVWVDMKETGVDVIVSAPQKGWSGPACCGIVMMSPRAEEQMRANQALLAGEGISFSCNLHQWHTVMAAYENADGKGPGFKYYTTLPTDALVMWESTLKELQSFGIAKCKGLIQTLGKRIRQELAKRNFKSVAADAFAAPGVVVVYSPVQGMVGKFKGFGIQVAGGVPWKLGEDSDKSVFPNGDPVPKQNCFRVGLFGLDKVKDIDATVKTFADALDALLASQKPKL